MRMKRIADLVVVAATLALVLGCNNTGNIGIDHPDQGAGPELHSGAAAAVVISGASQLVAGDCAPYSLQIVDGQGKASNANGNASVFQLAPSGKIFSDSTCSTAANTAAVNSTGAGQFFVRDTAKEQLNLVGTAVVTSGNLTGSKAVNVVGASPTALSLVAPATAAVNTCVPVNVALIDNFGNSTGNHSDTLVALTHSGLVASAIYSDSACATTASTVTIANGQEGRTVFAQANALGTQTVRADASGFTPVDVSVNWVAGSTPRVLLVAPSGNVVADSCVLVTAKSVRADGSSLVVAGSALDVALAVASAHPTSLYSDSSCAASLAANTVSIPVGSSMAPFFVKTAVAPQVTTLTGNATGYVSGTAPISWTTIPASKVALNGVPASLAAGSCSSGQVALLDAANNPAFVAAPTTVNLSGTTTSQVEFFSTVGCAGAPVSAVTVPMCVGLPCNNTLTFSFRPKKVGLATLTAASAGLNSASAAVDVVAPVGNPTTLVITRLTDPAKAGSCLQYVVDSKDAFGNVMLAPAGGLALNASSVSASGLGAFYLDGACAAPTNTVTIPAGTSTATFFFRDTKAEVADLTLSGTPSPTQQSRVTLLVGDANKLVWNFLPASSQASSCSSPVSVTQKDAYDNLTTTSTSVALSGSNGVAFYTDSNCTNPMVSAAILTGQSTSTTFYFSGPNTGATQLVATATTPASLVNPAVGNVLMTAPTVSRIAFACTTGGFAAPNCAPVAAGVCRPLYVASVDSANNFYLPVGSPVNVALASSSANVTQFFSNPSCTTAIAGNSVALSTAAHPRLIYVKNTVAESMVVSGTPSFGSAGSVTLQTTAGSPFKLVLSDTAGPATLYTANCSGPYELSVKDQFNNLAALASAATVNFQSSTLNGLGVDVANTFFADSGCTSNAVVIDAAAHTKAFYIRSATAGTLNLIGSATGLNSSNARSILISQAARLAFFSGSSEVTSVNFGNVVVGTNSQTQVLELRNTATADAASATAITLAAPYSRVDASSTCPTGPFQLTGGQSCLIGFRFVPASVGAAAGTLGVQYTSAQNAATRSASVSLTGSGINPTLVAPYLSLSSVNFGSVQIGATGNQTLSLVNPNAYAVSITGITAPTAPFVVTGTGTTPCSGSYPFTLSANSSCSLNVAFSPTAAATYSSSFSLQSSAGSTNSTGLSGVGYQLPGAALSISPNSYSFGTVALNSTSPSAFFTVTNLGGQSVDTIQLDNYALPFQVSMGTCVGTLAVGNSCTFSATFAPTASASYSASVRLRFRNVTSGSTTTLNSALILSGQGGASQSAANLVFDIPNGVYFYNIPLYQTATFYVMVTNNGQTAASSISISRNGSSMFNVVSSTCGSTLAAGGSCYLKTTFTPTGYGWQYGTFWLNYYSGATQKSTSTRALEGYAY